MSQRADGACTRYILYLRQYYSRNNGKVIFTIMTDYENKTNKVPTSSSGIDITSNLIASRLEKAMNMKYQSQYWSKADVLVQFKFMFRYLFAKHQDNQIIQKHTIQVLLNNFIQRIWFCKIIIKRWIKRNKELKNYIKRYFLYHLDLKSLYRLSKVKDQDSASLFFNCNNNIRNRVKVPKRNNEKQKVKNIMFSGLWLKGR